MSDQKHTPEDLDLGSYASTVDPAEINVYANPFGTFITAVPMHGSKAFDLKEYYGTQLTWEQASALHRALAHAIRTYSKPDVAKAEDLS